MKNKKAVFFDLDGTLLPVDLDSMFGEYWKILRESELIRMISGNREEAAEIIENAAVEMMGSPGGRSNREVFFEQIKKRTGKGAEYFATHFETFYEKVFDSLGWMIEENGVQRKIIDAVKKKGYRTALATMPVFPVGAAASRLAWVGLAPDDFEHITHWENTNYMKPQTGYYKEILERMNLEGKDCIMVGNNVREDMCARELGFDVFLVTGYEIGEFKQGDFPHGNLNELLAWVQELPCAEGII
jgi:FMN phosphatase YigB (HAD superfamily)